MSAPSHDQAGGFLARWARRKEQVRGGLVVESEPIVDAPASVPAPAAELAVPVAAAAPAEPLPTMADVALLTHQSDYARFVGAGVDARVRQAAMRKLFTDPHFNVMDGLDTYIDDYGVPDPIPAAMLRQMNQSTFLRLFDDDVPAEPPSTPDPSSPPDDHPDLQLQPDDVVGQPGPDQGAGA